MKRFVNSTSAIPICLVIYLMAEGARRQTTSLLDRSIRMAPPTGRSAASRRVPT
jgi:hypothetical protein